MKISEAARAAGVIVETIRYYERQGLIECPPRPAEGYRSYPAATVSRIRFIRNAKELGFSLNEVRRLLDLTESPQSHCGMVGAEARNKLADVRAKMAALERIEQDLARLLADCPGEGGLEKCPIITAIDAGGEKNGTRRRS